MERLNVLSRYSVSCAVELEKKIETGEIAFEHPAWEDVILLENLEATIALIDEDIKAIRESS